MRSCGSLAGLAVALLLLAGNGGAQAVPMTEPPRLADAVASGALPPVDQRIPAEPQIVEVEPEAGSAPQYGGTLHMLMGSAKETRQITVYGYARLVAYNPRFDLVPDILAAFEVEDGRIFTLHLRKGHRWSDGAPFTTEDFRYYWDSVANNPKLSPAGPPVDLLVDGKPPTVEILDETTVRYSWAKPNPAFLPALASPNPTYIFKPAHYLKQFHPKFTKPEVLEERVAAARQRNWAALHNKMDADTRTITRTSRPWSPGYCGRRPRRSASSSSAMRSITGSTRRGVSCPMSTR